MSFVKFLARAGVVIIGLLLGLTTLTLNASKLLPPQQIAFASDRDGDSEIYLLDFMTRRSVRLTRRPNEDLMPTWSPNGKLIAFESDRESNGEIFAMRIDSREVRRVVGTLHHNMSPDWSPTDEFTLVYFNDRGQINVVDVGAMHTIQLATNARLRDAAGPTWSPDGQQIAFQSSRNGSTEIYRMDADGSRIRRLTNNRAPDYTPDWSPDGRRMVFVSERDGDPEIYVMDVNGDNLRRLTFSPGGDYHPDWSPDGNWIVFNSARSGDSELYALNLTTGVEIRLTQHPGADGFAAWHP